MWRINYIVIPKTQRWVPGVAELLLIVGTMMELGLGKREEP